MRLRGLQKFGGKAHPAVDVKDFRRDFLPEPFPLLLGKEVPRGKNEVRMAYPLQEGDGLPAQKTVERHPQVGAMAPQFRRGGHPQPPRRIEEEDVVPRLPLGLRQIPDIPVQPALPVGTKKVVEDAHGNSIGRKRRSSLDGAAGLPFPEGRKDGPRRHSRHTPPG